MMFLKLGVLLVVLTVGLGFDAPSRPNRWEPRAFQHPQKRGLYSAGVRQFHSSRPHRSDPSWQMMEDYPALDESAQDYDDYEEYNTEPDVEVEKRGKYDDNKAYGFWISALNKAGNTKRSMRQMLMDNSKRSMRQMLTDNSKRSMRQMLTDNSKRSMRQMLTDNSKRSMRQRLMSDDIRI